MEAITAVFAANAAYGDPLLVAAGSLARQASIPVRFVILDGGLTEAQRERLVRAVSRCSGLPHAVRFRTVDETRFRGFRLMNGTAMTYARLLLPELLDEEWALYCDADVIWRGNVADFWALREEGCGAVATPDCAESAAKDEGLPGDYFCAGVMLINLVKWRSDGVSEKCGTWLAEHADARFWDQSALNRVLKGRVKLVDKAWNRYPREMGACKVLHYAGANPWQFGFRKNRLDRYKWMWFRELARLKGSTALTEALRAKFSALRSKGCR